MRGSIDNGEPTRNSEIEDNHRPLWKFVTELQKLAREQENWQWKLIIAK